VVQEEKTHHVCKVFLSHPKGPKYQFIKPLKQDVEIEGANYRAVSSVIIPLQQASYRLINRCFLLDRVLNDNTFMMYRNWNLALAFNLQLCASERQVCPVDTNRLLNQKSSNLSCYKGLCLCFSWMIFGATLLSRFYKAESLIYKLRGTHLL